MAIREILKYPDERLRGKTVPVERFDEDLKSLVRDLTESMYAARGAGLAAIQVGDPRRLFLVDATIAGGEESDPPLVFVNSEILSLEGTQTGDEGCLSFPGVFIEVERALRCAARARDAVGREFAVTAQDLYARAIQHENDHLEGRLLIDRAGPVKRRMIRRYMLRREWENETVEPEVERSAL